MTRRTLLTVLVAVFLVGAGGCATLGLMQIVAPTLRFIGFNSVSIQPEGVQFEVKLGIKFDGMEDDEGIHKWYVDDELEATE